MPTLVYSPGVRAYVQTSRAGLVDVTEDIVSGRVNRNTGLQPSTFSLVLSNRRRKYDRLFTPNDRITIFLKRLYWMQSFSGYLNSTPYFNAKPGTVTIDGSCTLKHLQHFHWDPNTSASQNLLNAAGPGSVPGDTSGLPNAVVRTKALLTEVAGWDDDRVHIGNIPPKWQDFVRKVVDEVREEQDALSNISTPGLGYAANAGEYGLGVTHPDRNLPQYAGNPSIGVFLETEGRGSYFGTKDDASTAGRHPALTSAETAPNGWKDPWYIALRIPTQHWGNESDRARGGGAFARGLTREQWSEGRRWWTNRKVLVTNPKNGNQFVGRVIDIGPNVRTGKAIDFSDEALHNVLRASTGDTFTWVFARDDAPLGPVTAPAGSSGGGASPISTSGTLKVPSAIPAGSTPSSGDFKWGGYTNGQIPLSKMSKVESRAQSDVYLHPIAAEAFVQMRAAAAKEGITIEPSSGKGYRTFAKQTELKNRLGNLAATPGTSNHGWGFAMDIGVGGKTNFSDPRYKWLQRNGARYGWVNPPRLRDGGTDEAWHWEFWGIFGAHGRAASRDSSGQTQYQIDIRPGQFDALGNGIPGTVPSLGTSATPVTARRQQTDSGVLAPTSQFTDGGLFQTEGITTGLAEDPFAVGSLLYSNDEPLLPSIDSLVKAAGRSFSSAPNGDFIAWFPDYFNIHNYAAVFDLVPMEVGDFSVNWSDDRLKTHFFVSGAVAPGGAGSSITGNNITNPTVARSISKGVASLESEGLLAVLLGAEDGQALADTTALLKRFGVRPERSQENNIVGPDAEFYIAVTKFMQNWAGQFSASIPLATFLPEVYPGMVVRSSELNFQAYVEGVSHSFDYTGGFKTSLSISAPSRLDGKGLLGAALTASRDLTTVGGGGD